MQNKKTVIEATFKKNLQYLPILLQQRISKINMEDIWNKVNVISSEHGHPVCIYNDGNKKYHINSIKPVKEAKNWYSHLSLEDASALFIYGSGFGYPLFEIVRKKQPNTIVIVFEQDIAIFAAMLHYFDFEPIFKTQKFRFFVGNPLDFAEEFQQLFFSDVFLYTTAPFIAFTPTAQRNLKKEYLTIHTYVFHELSLNVFYLGNDHYDTLLGFHNLIDNVKEIIDNPYLNTLKDKYKNIPAFIISNGPSLDKNINELKKINGKGIIISTESTIVPLMKNGIKPDILSVVERVKIAYTFHFKDRNYPEDLSLLALAVIDKHIFPSFTGPKIPIFRNTESINRWMNKFLGNESSELDAGANVSHLAFEIAVYLGANPIIFVGQDFAFSPDGFTHSKDAAYQEKGKDYINKIKSRPVVHVEGNDGKLIPSTQLWLDFKQGLERKIATHSSQVKVINATEGGAKIKGTTNKTLKDTIQDYCKAPIQYQVHQLINDDKKEIDRKKRREKLIHFVHELDQYAEKFHKLSQLAIKGRLRTKKMLELTKINQLDDRTIAILEKGYEDNFIDLKKFMNNNLYLVFLQQVLLIGFHKMNRLGVINSIERIKKVFQIHDELFQQLNLVSQSVMNHFEFAAEKLETSFHIKKQ